MASANNTLTKCKNLNQIQQGQNTRKRKNCTEKSNQIRNDTKTQENHFENFNSISTESVSLERSSTPYPPELCDHCRHEHKQVSLNIIFFI